VQVAAGVIGASPAPAPTCSSRSTRRAACTEEEFGDIIVKTGTDGEIVRLRDIARIELGAAEYFAALLLDNKPAVAHRIFQAPGSNASRSRRCARPWPS
jgi:multidrug efflux pump